MYVINLVKAVLHLVASEAKISYKKKEKCSLNNK